MKWLMRHIKDQGGFTFVETVMAAGMLGLLAVTIMYSEELFKKEVKKSGTQANRQKIVSTIQRLISNRQACENTFLNLDPVGLDGSVVPSLRDFDNTSILTPPQTIGAGIAGDTIGSTGQIQVTEMRLSHYEDFSAPHFNRTQEATLSVSMVRLQGSNENIGNVDIIERFKVRVDATGGTVTRCNANEGFGLEQACMMLQGTYEVLPTDAAICRSIYGMRLGGLDTIARPADNAYAVELEDSSAVTGTTLVRDDVWLNNNAVGTGVTNYGPGDLYVENGSIIRGSTSVGLDAVPGGTNTLYLERGLGISMLGSAALDDDLEVPGPVVTGVARMFNFNQNIDQATATVGFVKLKLANLLSDDDDRRDDILTDVLNAINSEPTVADSMTNYVCSLASGDRTLDVRGVTGAFTVGTYNAAPAAKDCTINIDYNLTNCQVDEGESTGENGSAANECPTIYGNTIHMGATNTNTWEYLVD